MFDSIILHCELASARLHRRLMAERASFSTAIFGLLNMSMSDQEIYLHELAHHDK